MNRLIIIALLLASVAGCKTTEANYREAYEKAMAGRDSSATLENTIYGRDRRQVGYQYITLPDSSATVAVKRQLVRITEDGGGIRENLRRYCVVIGQFKQKFNAVSMRDRLAIDEGTVPGAFVVQTAEPYYYVLGASCATLPEAISKLKEFTEKPPVVMREPLPFILEATATGSR